MPRLAIALPGPTGPGAQDAAPQAAATRQGFPPSDPCLPRHRRPTFGTMAHRVLHAAILSLRRPLTALPALTSSTARLCVAILAALLALASAATAHAVLQAAQPPDGALLAGPPAEARLTFNEAVRPLSLRLIAPGGAETDLTSRATGGTELVIPLGRLGRGTHVLSWRVVSGDGHPVPGALMFSVGAPTSAAAPPDGAPGVRGALWLARLLMVAGLVAGVGGAAFGLIAPLPLAARRPARLATLAGLMGAAAFLGLHGLDALGLGLAALATPAPWLAAAGTSFGPAIALAMGAGLLALAGRQRPLWAAAALGLLGLSHAVSGHAGAAWPQALTRPMVALHLIALTLWIGALLPLALSLRSGAEGLRRFSRAIPAAVAVLAATGLGLAFVQLGRDPGLWPSPYGYILTAKLGLLALLAALAARNRWHLTAPALAGDPAAARRMRHSIGLELLLALAILGLTAGWRFTPPPRALAATAPPALAHLHSDTAMATLALSPAGARIELSDGDLAPLPAIGVTLHLSLPGRGIEPLSRPATPEPGADGIWTVPGLALPLPGEWEVALDIRLDRFRLTTLHGTLGIGAAGARP